MQTPTSAQLLRVFIGEAARYDGKPLYEAIVLKARDSGLVGSTVLRGAMGYGHSNHLHNSKILRLSADLPLIVEIIDSEDKIKAFLPALDELMSQAKGLVTLETVQTMSYGPSTQSAG
jgi:uncharacterized protein